MRTVFLGSGDFAAELLRSLTRAGMRLAAVVTGPDRPAGRGLRLTPPAVKVACSSLGLEAMQPGTPRDAAFADALRGLKPDAVLVADYGFLLGRDILEIPPRGCLNVHPSLLPRYRGAAPIQRALMDGVEESGVSLMLLDEGLDTGPILCQRSLALQEDDDAGTLRARLARLGADMVAECLPRYAEGRIEPRPQGEDGASYAPPLDKSEREIDWTRDSRVIRNLVRALSPKPGAYTTLERKRIIILRASLAQGREEAEPGTILAADGASLVVAAGEGALAVELIQPEGRKAMGPGDFVRGYRPRTGDKMGGPR